MLAETAPHPFNGSDWIFEVKWDGIRAIAYVDEKLKILSRSGQDLTFKFPELQELISLTSRAVLDGEIIVMENGHPNFAAVAKRSLTSNIHEVEVLVKKHPVTYVVFDILEKDGFPFIDFPLMERLHILRESLHEGPHTVISDYIDREGEKYYEAILEHGLEGLIAKQKTSIYRPGERSSEWLKLKAIKSVDCVVFGYTLGKGARSNLFGSLLLGLYNDGVPVYVGRVGTGFADSLLKELKKMLDQIKTRVKPFESFDIPNDSTWVEPIIVVEVGYQEFTASRRLRSPRLLRLRNDKDPHDCTVDQVNGTALADYTAKRNLSKTPEPAAEVKSETGNRYVIQEHHASHIHWDLRLEREGVLKSWAVPKQPSEKPGERRLAVQVEDHPIDYANFEGTIPDGEYGAGTVKIWDKGTYISEVWNQDKIQITINGERLHGSYELVRFKKAGENDWLLFKKREG